MGIASSNLTYSVELPNQNQPINSTKTRRHPDYINGLHSYPQQNLKTMQNILINSFQKYSKNKALGKIVQQKQKNEKGQQILNTRKIEYFTYQQVKQKVDSLGKAIIKLNLAPQIQQVPGFKMNFIGIFSKNRIQWLFVDLSAILFGFVVVPIYDTLGPENIPYVLEHTKVQTCFCSKQSILILIKALSLGSLKTIVTFDKLQKQTVEQLKKRNLKLQQIGQKLQYTYPLISANKCLTFSYTSGTTGAPKGAMLSHGNFSSLCAVLKYNKDIQIKSDGRYLSYLPLPHVLERICVYGYLYYGACIVCYSGDVQKIKDDLQIVQPTNFCSVPRLYNKFYDTIKQKFEKVQGVKKIILNKSLNVKLKNAVTNGGFTHKIYDRLIFNATKKIFGGHVTCMISGSAPLLPHVQTFMKVIACAPLLQGYGQTQSTGASFITTAYDPQTGHVGGPTSNVQFKLFDIQQMNYTHQDKDQQGKLAPRGEICIRGPGVFLGYYKDQQKTKQAIDQEGWLHTGDIAVLLPQTGALKIIDRKKNIFKLQQGEYVASQKVEATYLKKSNAIVQMFLYGDSRQNFAIAIMVPHQSFILQIAKKNNINGNFEQLCKMKQIRIQVMRQMNNFVKKEGLNSFQQAKNIYLEPISFGLKGILTNTMKLQRHEAKKAYKTILQNLYKQGMLLQKK